MPYYALSLPYISGHCPNFGIVLFFPVFLSKCFPNLPGPFITTLPCVSLSCKTALCFTFYFHIWPNILLGWGRIIVNTLYSACFDEIFYCFFTNCSSHYDRLKRRGSSSIPAYEHKGETRPLSITKAIFSFVLIFLSLWPGCRLPVSSLMFSRE